MKLTPPTIKDIADRANVSISTVSRALNNKSVVRQDTRTAVLEAAKLLGYEVNVFARGLAGGQSMTIGVVSREIGCTLYDTVMQGVIRGFAGTGYSPIFIEGQSGEDFGGEMIQKLISRRVDGIMTLGGDDTFPENLLNHLPEELPAIVIGKSVKGWEKRCVVTDNFGASYQATQLLIENGHRDIAIIRGDMHIQDAISRYDGYCKALEDANLKVLPDLIQNGDFLAHSGLMGIHALLARGKPFTAVVCGNDQMAIGAKLALQRRGIRVPEDVSLIGFDDEPLSAYVSPPLTTLRQSGVEMGRIAAKGLIDLISAGSCELPLLACELVERESVAKLRST
ncbi:HTH-type transcriptional repressor PurR [Rubripirellula obstinata]|uniref:HTH-type transcriptional repressor PurR n=1 Tax=Rubripirellula obstinata TaxID=406547 RepID=A0A5B1CK30_9BACT|nr:LacI family DNA-binding transcriptional regulator [Rubripirellula obstinata]KAA1260651.1 HTH-type transcriptional repressor PurR [Rubripirellula obstinata]